MEVIRYKSIIKNEFEEYEVSSDDVNHEANVFSPCEGPFTILFAPYWVEHIENDTFFYYDQKFYESGVVSTTIDRYERSEGSSLEGLLNFISEFNHKQIIKPQASDALLMREHEENEGYSISHWNLALQTTDEYVVLNLSFYPLRPDEVPEGLYEKYIQSLEETIHDIDYLLVHANIKSH